MKTFTTAHKELSEKLNAEHQALLERTEAEDVSLEKWEKSEGEKLGACSLRLIQAVSDLRDTALTRVQASVSARMVAIKTRKSSMQAAQKEKDTFKFLQMYSQVYQDVEKAKAVDLRRGLEPGSERDTLLQEIRRDSEKMVDQTNQFWSSMLALIDPENPELNSAGSDLTLDPQMLGAGMSLSRNNRTVFQNTGTGKCDALFLISSNQTTENIQRWTVTLSENCDWVTGLCEKKNVRNVQDGPVYALCCRGDEVSFLSTDCETKQQKSDKLNTEQHHEVYSALISYKDENGDKAVQRPETVEVFWDAAASSLAFFIRLGKYLREEIVTIKMSTNNWDLVPFISLSKESGQNTAQQQWQCSCGLVYGKTLNGHTIGRRMYPQPSNCSCGAIIGGPSHTDVLCELQ
ncbi:uncharacterized protein ACBR49_019084 isoform 2-T2 [Aulostomus maculatus]